MHAVRGANLQLHAAVRFLGHFVHGCGTKILAGIPVLLDAFGCADIGICNLEMARLILFMARPGVIHICQPIESELAVSFESFRSWPAVDFLICFMSRVRPHRIDQPASAGDLLERGVKKSAEHSMLERLVKIPDLP